MGHPALLENEVVGLGLEGVRGCEAQAVGVG